jgi:hypothetical protein
LSQNKKTILVIGNFLEDNFIELMLKISSEEIINLYNTQYGESFNEINLNDNNSGLLFLIKENGIEFYTRKNNEKLSIFVEFA